MPIFLFVFCLIASQLFAQKWYAQPNFSVKYLSYFGIGSESVQQASVLGNNAAMYALMQREFPNLVGQGIGVPFFFYQQTIKNSGADILIQNLLTEYPKLKNEEKEKRLKAIREKISTTTISDHLKSQLNNAIQEFYKGKKIRLSLSPNYHPKTMDSYQAVKPTYTVVIETKDIATAVVQAYAAFWENDVVEERFSNRERLKMDALATGLLLTEAFEYGYAIGRVRTDYTSSPPSIKIMSKREESTERIGFASFDAKWYRTYEKATTANVFVDNAALTPTVRQLQDIMKKMDPLLRSFMPKSDSLKDKDYTSMFTFIIQKQGTHFSLQLQQPELQLLWVNK